jgi:chemotaxis methyl-accepting protein methylase/PAS domain-containing protein
MISGMLDRSAPASDTTGKLGGKSRAAIETIVALLQNGTRHDYSLYKRNTLLRRVERRMAVHRLDAMEDYVDFLKLNPQEVDLLLKEMLIGVTAFFRDPAAWQVLAEQALPGVFATYPEGRALRAWVVGCSTGEEAYSLAIVFSEVLERVRGRGRFSLQIFATDLQEDAITKARVGLYPASIAANVSAERLDAFFGKEGGHYRIRRSIRDMVTFSTQDVVVDPPFTKLDIVVCRNVLIYFQPALQKRVISLFHYSLNPGGILFLGSACSVAGFEDGFSSVQAKARIYLSRGKSARPPAMQLPGRQNHAGASLLAPVREGGNAISLQASVDQLLISRFAPATVLINQQGDVLYARGRTGKYLEPAAGKANWNVFAMAREGLRSALTPALRAACRSKAAVTVKGLQVHHEGGVQAANLLVHYIDEPESLRGLILLVFTEVEAATRGRVQRIPANARVSELEQVAREAQEDLRITSEEMQTAQEELKTTNEELQSTNEELQSTNEELTTSKEEMQSMNEELQMVNHELQAKVDELSWASDDMKNLLNSTDIATVFLTNDLHVRRFTTQAVRLFKLIPGDVGRPLTDITNELDYPLLQEDSLQVLRTKVFTDKEVSTRDGRWFNVRIMPYLTTGNKMDGVVMTFTDITRAKALEAKLRMTISEAQH